MLPADVKSLRQHSKAKTRVAASWQTFRDDNSIRVVVLTAAQGSTFCAGFDLSKTIPLFTGARAPADEWDEALLSDRGLAGNT